MLVTFHSMLMGHGDFQISETEGIATISNLLAFLKVDPGEIGVILINDELADFHDPIEPDDRIDFYPVFGGG